MPRRTSLLSLAGVASLLGAGALAPSFANAAPAITGVAVTSGIPATLVWTNAGPTELLSMRVEVNLDPSGGTAGAWLSIGQGARATGENYLQLDARGLVPDGGHQLRLVADDASGTSVAMSPRPLVIDSSGPEVGAPEIGALVDGRFLPVAVSASDPQVGLDLTRPVDVEVEPWDPERRAPAGGWRRLAELSTTPEGVGVDVSALTDGEYLLRVGVRNLFGLVGRSPSAWFAKVPARHPAPEAPPKRILLRLSERGSFRAPSSHPHMARRGGRFAFTAQVRGPGGEPLAGYRVTVRMADGRGFERTTDEQGVMRFSAPVTHGGLVRVRASRHLPSGLSVVKHDLTLHLEERGA